MEFHFLPKYRAHKVVEALKIAAIVGSLSSLGPVTIEPEDQRFKPFEVQHEWWMRARTSTDAPLEGGYWVRYENGYQSWSPAKEFEEGYTLATVLTPELLRNLRAVVAKDLISDEEISTISQMVYGELREENAGVIGGPDVIHMEYPGRLAQAVTEMVLNKLSAMA